MKINDWLTDATARLSNAGIATARLDCLVLLEDATGKDRAWLLAHPNDCFQGRALETVKEQVLRRGRHEPLAYIRGKSEFYGREFVIDAHTLEPRPETETMIDLLKEHYRVAPCNVIDVGTGSGCLAVTAKLELPGGRVYGTDIDSECIKIARQNAKKLGADVQFYKGDLLSSLPPAACRLPPVLLCNLPYVPDSHTINQAAMFEPKHAIFGGPDGLDLYRQLFLQIANLPQKPAYVLTESLPFQHQELAKIAQAAGYKLKKTDNFIQLFGKADGFRD